MKVVLAIPKEDQVINEFVKKWPKVEVLDEIYDISDRKEMGDLPFNTDVIVISEGINSDYHKVIEFLNWWRFLSKRSHVILLSNAKEDHILLKECITLGGSVIDNLPNLSLVNLAKTMFIGKPGQGVTERVPDETSQAKRGQPIRSIGPIKVYQGIQGAISEYSDSVESQAIATKEVRNENHQAEFGQTKSDFIIKWQPGLHDLAHTDRSAKTNSFKCPNDRQVEGSLATASRLDLQSTSKLEKLDPDEQERIPEKEEGIFANEKESQNCKAQAKPADFERATTAQATVSDFKEPLTKTTSSFEHIAYLPKQIREFVCDPANLDYLQLIHYLKVDRRLSVKSIATIIDHCTAIKALLKEMG